MGNTSGFDWNSYILFNQMNGMLMIVAGDSRGIYGDGYDGYSQYRRVIRVLITVHRDIRSFPLDIKSSYRDIGLYKYTLLLGCSWGVLVIEGIGSRILYTGHPLMLIGTFIGSDVKRKY